MDLIDKLFYINLDERTDRKQHFIEQCKIHDIPEEKIERYPAINGNKYLFTTKELDMFRNADFNRHSLTPHIIVKKLMGNQLSHFNILIEMKKRNYNNIIICQDDTIFKTKFVDYIKLIMKDIPIDAELINIGFHKVANGNIFERYDIENNNMDNSIIENKVTDFVYLYSTWNKTTGKRINPASLAYIVTKKGCDNLLDYFNTIGFNHATDWNYNLYLQSKNIFYGSKYILATGNELFKSDVFINTSDYLLEDLIDINLYYTDKNTTHSYFDTYNNLFKPIRDDAKNILEIGMGNFNPKNGGSILLWRMFFKNALIHGVDIVAKDRIYDIILKDENIKTYLNTDAYNLDFIDNFKKSNINFDVIIDDGPHTFETQCKCIELYSDLLTNNGMLIIEDVQDINWIQQFIQITPVHLHKFIQVYDLRNNKHRYDDILFVINKNITNTTYNNITIPLVVSHETNLHTNANTIMFKKTLDKYKWDYKFIGDGLNWSGFKDKIIRYYHFLTSNNVADDKIVVLSDSRDVFCLKPPDLFIEQIKPIIENKIIISAELFLQGHMDWSDNQIFEVTSKDSNYFWQGCPLNEYWEYYKINPVPFRKYVNSGLIVGKTKYLKTALKWIIDHHFTDDQFGFSKYTNKFPNLVYLDYESTILHTSTSYVNCSFYNHNIQKIDTPTFNELFGLSNYFLHIPGLNISKGQKYMYDIIYAIFNNDIINKDIRDIYSIKHEYPIRDCVVR